MSSPRTTPPSLLALIGYRGTGKTTVAQLLAERLHWAWMDADHEIESRAEKSIQQLFAEGGESLFRDWESRVVLDLMERVRCVVALGGGAVLREENRQAIRRAYVVWLTGDPHTLLRRISGDPATSQRRPNLTSAGGLAEIEQLLVVREPLYRDCADCSVSTVGKTPEQVADEIVCLLQARSIPFAPDKPNSRSS